MKMSANRDNVKNAVMKPKRTNRMKNEVVVLDLKRKDGGSVAGEKWLVIDSCINNAIMAVVQLGGTPPCDLEVLPRFWRIDGGEHWPF